MAKKVKDPIIGDTVGVKVLCERYEYLNRSTLETRIRAGRTGMDLIAPPGELTPKLVECPVTGDLIPRKEFVKRHGVPMSTLVSRQNDGLVGRELIEGKKKKRKKDNTGGGNAEFRSLNDKIRNQHVRLKPLAKFDNRFFPTPPPHPDYEPV